ncbi:MAG TPA: divalent-cation tolerance protein CutA [Burkholderiaceae bacterium]|nr:divalent-cation tolerance protein CutA [Burkholderiaceae bacterium]
MPQPLLVLTSLPDLAGAQALARALVQQQLAACVNILPAVQSVYRWQGALEDAAEVGLVVKTTEARYAELELAIKLAHPYELPEIIALPIVAGLPAYLAWIAAETRKDIKI